MMGAGRGMFWHNNLMRDGRTVAGNWSEEAVERRVVQPSKQAHTLDLEVGRADRGI